MKEPDLSSKNVLNRMSIEGSRGNGSSPLMMDLVDVLVDEPVVEQSVSIVEPSVMTQHGHKDMQETGAQVRQLSDVPSCCPLAPQTVGGIARQGTQHNLHIKIDNTVNLNSIIPG